MKKKPKTYWAVKSPDGEKPSALIYNRNRSLMQFFDITEDLSDLMDGESKKFYHCKIKNSTLEIGEEAPWQDW